MWAILGLMVMALASAKSDGDVHMHAGRGGHLEQSRRPSPASRAHVFLSRRPRADPHPRCCNPPEPCLWCCLGSLAVRTTILFDVSNASARAQPACLCHAWCCLCVSMTVPAAEGSQLTGGEVYGHNHASLQKPLSALHRKLGCKGRTICCF